jgi:hypothetical protein
MFKNRFILVIGVLSLLLVAMAVSLPRLDTVIIPVTGPEADQPYIMDSATRSYIAWGQAMQARNAMDSGTRSYIAWGQALERAKLNALDSGTRSYIAWGEALQAAGKLGDSNACSNTTQENIFAGIPDNLDSATRSYIAWGLALQAKNDIGVLCR